MWEPSYYDVLQNTVGGGKPKMKWHFTNTCGGKWPSRSGELGDAPPPATEEEQMALIDELQDKKTEIYKGIVDQCATARPGVLSLMDEAIADPNIAVGICSAATKAGFEKVVNAVVSSARSLASLLLRHTLAA